MDVLHVGRVAFFDQFASLTLYPGCSVGGCCLSGKDWFSCITCGSPHRRGCWRVYLTQAPCLCIFLGDGLQVHVQTSLESVTFPFIWLRFWWRYNAWIMMDYGFLAKIYRNHGSDPEKWWLSAIFPIISIIQFWIFWDISLQMYDVRDPAWIIPSCLPTCYGKHWPSTCNPAGRRQESIHIDSSKKAQQDVDLKLGRFDTRN